MAIPYGGRTELPMVVKKYKERETSPERTKVWTERKPKAERKVPVVYYLSRNGQLEHPHFIEVPVLSPEGLYLRDVINRLNFLRGKGMASLYSWSSKRSYKNGFVWHDLSENDFIYPAHGQEYVLKGSEILEDSPISRSQEIASSEKLPNTQNCGEEHEFGVVRRRNQSWSHIDLNQYKVYKTESTVETALRAANASTQTDDKSRRRRKPPIREAAGNEARQERVEEEEEIISEEMELSREEISPPPSSSSPETLESLIKADGPVTLGVIEEGEIRDRTDNNHPSGRIKASTVLMQLISCGSISVKDHGISLISQYRGRLPRCGGSDQAAKEIDGLMENPSFAGVRLEDKEYFSGSLVEIKKENGGIADFQGLKRSSSYNADRSSKSDLMEKESVGSRSKSDLMEKESVGSRSKCIPGKPKVSPMKKETNSISRSSRGSKRVNE